MAIDLKEVRKTVIDSIKLAIGDDLSQTTNPVTQETYGLVMNARPNPEKPVPEYPYAVLDVLAIDDTDWYLTALNYDSGSDRLRYETHKTITMQISIFGGDAILLGNKLATAYRRDDMITLLREGEIGIADVQNVQILPELLQTDWLEAAFVQLTVRVNDIFIDPESEIIDAVILDGELECTGTGTPIPIHIDTTQN